MSDFDKLLKKNSGKSLKERWKGRRVSDNVIDETLDPIKKIIEAEAKSMKPLEAPRPRANKKQDRPRKNTELNSQVTPGEWKTK